MRYAPAFNRDAALMAAELERINPTGVNPLRERTCKDCGRATREQYLCRECAADLKARRASTAATA